MLCKIRVCNVIINHILFIPPNLWGAIALLLFLATTSKLVFRSVATLPPCTVGVAESPNSRARDLMATYINNTCVNPVARCRE